MFSTTNARVVFGATAILYGSLILTSCGGGGGRAGRHPAVRRHAGRHPAVRRHAGRRHAGRHPAGRHPAGRHPAGRRHAGRHPAGRRHAGDQHHPPSRQRECARPARPLERPGTGASGAGPRGRPGRRGRPQGYPVHLARRHRRGCGRRRTLMRNIRPPQLDVIGERDGITFGQWKGGPAGTFNIEFDFQFSPNLDPHFRALMERAGKAWSYRFANDFRRGRSKPVRPSQSTRPGTWSIRATPSPTTSSSP